MALALLSACSGESAAIGADLEATVDAAIPIAEAGPEASGTDAQPERDAGVVQGQDAAQGGAGCKGMPLCDDFESYPQGAAPNGAWSVAHRDCSGSGTVAIDTSQAHSGAKAVKVVGGGGYCDHVFIANSAGIGQVGKQFYVRFYARFETAFGDQHVTFLAMKDDADNGKDLRMGAQTKAFMYNRESDDATLPDQSPAGVAASLVPSPQRWYCVELFVDESAGTIATWIDGAQIAGLVENGTPQKDISDQWLTRAWRPSLADLRLGWESYSGETETLFIDDVGLGAQRIGCNP